MCELQNDKAVWRTFAESFCKNLLLPKRIIQSDTLVWVEPGPCLNRLVLFRYNSQEPHVHRAAINLHESYPLMSWDSLVVDGITYAYHPEHCRNRRAVRLVDPASEWSPEFTFHTDEAVAAGVLLAGLVVHRQNGGVLPQPQMEFEFISSDFDPLEELLSTNGYLWTRNASDAMERRQRIIDAQKERARLRRISQSGGRK